MSEQDLTRIEAVLTEHPAVRSVALSWSHDALGARQLIARIAFEKREPAPALIDFSLFFFGAENETGETGDYQFFLDAARFADMHGFEAIWTPERHFHQVGGLYPNPATLSAALAVITNRVKLRAGSVALPLHQTLRVAEEWAVVDCLSNGRAGIAIATGWHPRDFALAPERFETRRQRRIDGIDLLTKLWAGESVLLPDGRGESSEIRIFPRPVQPTLPMWVTATGHPDTFAYAGRIGAGVLTHLWDQNIEKLTANIQIYRDALAEAAYPLSRGHVAVMVHTFVSYNLERTFARCKKPFIDYMKKHLNLLQPAMSAGEEIEPMSERELAAVAEFAFKRYSRTASLIGTPQSCAAMVARLRTAGVDEVACLVDWVEVADARGGLEPLRLLKDVAQSTSGRLDEVRQYCQERLLGGALPDAFVEVTA
jgi:natural product biosynthesis luciferase-like monooxygenase protein